MITCMTILFHWLNNLTAKLLRGQFDAQILLRLDTTKSFKQSVAPF